MTNNFRLKDFWKFINLDEKNVYEIRIKDWKASKAIGMGLNIPYYSGGVFVRSYKEALSVVKLTRKDKTLWISVNPRKKAYNQWGALAYGGKDENVYSIKHVFIDIDRVISKEKATIEDKRKVSLFVDNIIKDFNEVEISKICRIDSGNGEQLLLSLDEEIVLPTLEFDYSRKIYTHNKDFEKHKQLIKKVFLEKLAKKYNTKKNKDLYGCKIDESAANIGRVCALHGSFNFKYNEKTPRKIISIENKESTGLSDSIIIELESLSLPVYNYRIVGNALAKEYKFKETTIEQSALTKFILEEEISSNTGVNNTLIFQFKCLCKDNGISLNSPAVRDLKKRFEQKFKRVIAWNTPSAGFHFSPNAINNYCLENAKALVYEPWWNLPKKTTFETHIFNYENYRMLDWKPLNLSFKSVSDGLYQLKKIFCNNVETIYGFIKDIEEAKGKEYACWFLENVYKGYLEKM